MRRGRFFALLSASLLLYGCVIEKQRDEPFSALEFAKSELLAGAVGPESFAFDPHGGGPYTGLSDGRIVKWEPQQRQWMDFAVASPTREGCEGPHDHGKTEHACGRPLGLRFDEATGDLYVADAYMGLLRVGPDGKLATRIATRAQGLPFGFTNGLDIDPRSGMIYFTDSSSIYARRNYICLIMSGDRTGRLMRYDPETKQVTILLQNLAFPNGVALSEDGTYVLVAETTTCRILRCWLNDTSRYEVFARVPGFPDNIKRSPRGGFWVGINTRRDALSDLVTSNPWVGRALLKLPVDFARVHSVVARYRGRGLAVRLGEGGEVLEKFEDERGNRWRSISEAYERDGKLWVGSVDSGFAGIYKI